MAIALLVMLLSILAKCGLVLVGHPVLKTFLWVLSGIAWLIVLFGISVFLGRYIKDRNKAVGYIYVLILMISLVPLIKTWPGISTDDAKAIYLDNKELINDIANKGRSFVDSCGCEQIKFSERYKNSYTAICYMGSQQKGIELEADLEYKIRWFVYRNDIYVALFRPHELWMFFKRGQVRMRVLPDKVEFYDGNKVVSVL